MSRVDVIIPCYNYGRYLPACVASVLSQPVEVRVLIIDDASQDDTAEVAARLAEADARTTFRRHATNQGHIATYNEGLAWADGDYTVLLSADDLLTPGALGRAVRLLDAHPEVGFVYGSILKFSTNEALPPAREFPGECPATILSGEQWIAQVCAAGWNPIASPEVVVRTCWQQRLGGYRSDLPHAGDLEMWLRFAAQTYVAVLDADQAYYRTHSSNMHHGYRGVKDCQQIYAAFACFFQNHARQLEKAEQRRAAAYRALSQMALRRAYHAFFQDDPALCQEALALATTIYPPIRYAPFYARARVMTWIGLPNWLQLRRALGRGNAPLHRNFAP